MTHHNKKSDTSPGAAELSRLRRFLREIHEDLEVMYRGDEVALSKERRSTTKSLAHIELEICQYIDDLHADYLPSARFDGCTPRVNVLKRALKGELECEYSPCSLFITTGHHTHWYFDPEDDTLPLEEIYWSLKLDMKHQQPNPLLEKASEKVDEIGKELNALKKKLTEATDLVFRSSFYERDGGGATGEE